MSIALKYVDQLAVSSFFFQRLLKTFLIKAWKINPPNIHCMLLFTSNLHKV